MDVQSPDLGLRCRANGRNLWIAGEGSEYAKERFRLMRVKPKKGVFRYKGDKWALKITVNHREVADALRLLDFQVLTVDGDPRRRADITCPPEQWEYQTYPQGNFDAMWFRVLTSSRDH